MDADELEAAEDRDADLIAEQLPKHAAAMVFYPSGALSMLIPKMADGEQAPVHVLAMTELMFRVEEGELPIHELAAAFKARQAS